MKLHPINEEIIAKNKNFDVDPLDLYSIKHGNEIGGNIDCQSQQLCNDTIEAFDPLALPIYPYSKIKVFNMGALKTDGFGEKNLKVIYSKFKDKPRCGYRYLMPANKNFIKTIKSLKKTFPNCIEFLDFVEDFACLSTYSASKAFRLPPVLLNGPPGIGKTQIVKTVVKALGVAYRQVDCGALTSPAILSGSANTYADSSVGIVCATLRDSLYANSFILLDEIDKARRNISSGGQDMLGSLYSLLEPSSNSEFVDEALGHPINASHINFIGTCNDITLLDGPMASRFYVINIGTVEGRHHRAVTSSIYEVLLENSGYEKFFSQNLSDPVLSELEALSPREIKTYLMRAMARAAKSNKKTGTIKIDVDDFLFDEKITSKVTEVAMGFY